MTPLNERTPSRMVLLTKSVMESLIMATASSAVVAITSEQAELTFPTRGDAQLWSEILQRAGITVAENGHNDCSLNLTPQ